MEKMNSRILPPTYFVMLNYEKNKQALRTTPNFHSSSTSQMPISVESTENGRAELAPFDRGVGC